MATTDLVFDVDEARFDEEVVERSREVPVVVDFWAAWCGPCRTLGPILEQAVARRGGEVLLAKVDVDRNRRLAARFRVQGIPAVKAFRDGAVADEFVGALPQRQVEAFLDRLVPSEADRLVTRARGVLDDDPAGAEDLLRRALEADPGHRDAAVELAALVVDRDPARALDLVAAHRPDPAAERVAARAELAGGGAADLPALRVRVEREPADAGARLELGRGLAAAGRYDEAVEHLLEAVAAGDGDVRDEARNQLLGLFRILGQDDPLVAGARRRLASVLY